MSDVYIIIFSMDIMKYIRSIIMAIAFIAFASKYLCCIDVLTNKLGLLLLMLPGNTYTLFFIRIMFFFSEAQRFLEHPKFEPQVILK